MTDLIIWFQKVRKDKMNRKAEKWLKQARAGASKNNVNLNFEQAVNINKDVTKEDWLNHAKNGQWAIGHYSTPIIFEYRNGIVEVEKYVKQIPDSEFAEFVTWYGAYLKAVAIRKLGDKYIRAKKLVTFSIQDPQGFFPSTYNKEFNDHLKSMYEMFTDSNLNMVIT